MSDDSPDEQGTLPPGRPDDGAGATPLHPYLEQPRQPGDLGQLGPYRVLEELGAGGMGIVFRAEDTNLRRQVALKVMRPELASSPHGRSRFLREARALAAFRHPHLVPIFQADEVVVAGQRVAYLAMPLLAGEMLSVRLRRETLPLADVLRIGREVAEGLAVVHAAGLVHRDVKPGNIWLETGADGVTRAVLLDFGLVRGEQVEDEASLPGCVLGTPGYLAPEQAEGQATDARADLFSLGCVLYRMATGRAPFDGLSPTTRLMQVLSELPPPPREVNPDIPPETAALIEEMLAREADKRPASAREVVGRLRGLEEAEQLKKEPPPRLPPVNLPMSAVLGSAVIMAEPPPELNGYKLRRRLASDTLADAYEAEAPGGFRIALKVHRQPLVSDDMSRALKSLKIFQQLRHDCLVQVQACWIQPVEERLCVAMDLADCTLRDRLQECQQAASPGEAVSGIPPRELWAYFRDAADALDYLHTRAIIHRDVKPANILLFNVKRRASLAGQTEAPEARAKLDDSGMACQLERHGLEASGGGTPAYMAPEACRNRTCYASDQYSLAASYAELRLGRPLFPYTNLYELVKAHLEETPELAPLSLTERRVLLIALAKKPEERFPNCMAFVTALEKALDLAPIRPSSGSFLTSELAARSAALDWPEPSDADRSTEMADTNEADQAPGPAAPDNEAWVPPRKKKRKHSLAARVGATLAALGLVAVLVFAGYKIFTPNPPPAVNVAQVEQAIENGEYRKASDLLKTLADQLTTPQGEIALLHQRNAEAWNRAAAKAYAAGDLGFTKSTLRDLLTVYANDQEALRLQQKIAK